MLDAPARAELARSSIASNVDRALRKRRVIPNSRGLGDARPLLAGNGGYLLHEFGILSFQQLGQQRLKITPAAPVAHVVLPGRPQTFGLAAHVFLIDEQVGALEDR